MTVAAGRGGAHGYWRVRGIATAILCITCVGVSVGLLTPLIAVKLEQQSGSGLIIGANALMAALSTVIAAPFVPGLLARYEPRRLIALAALMTGGAVAMFSLTSAISMWFVLRLTAGLAITVVFVGVETWINQLAPHHARARILGLYAATLAGGFGAGAALFAFIGAEGDTGFWLGATFSALPALGMWAPAPRPSAPKAAAAGPSALLRIARASPIPIVAACAFGAIELASLNFLPVYGLRLGFGEGGAGVVLIALSLGSILLQTPIGWTADRVGRQRVLDICAIASVIAPIAVIVAGESLAAVCIAVFLYGGAMASLYAVGLALLAQKTPAGDLASANAVFVFAYGVGSFVSPPVTGGGMDLIDPHGALIALASFAVFYLVASGVLRRRALTERN